MEYVQVREVWKQTEQVYESREVAEATVDDEVSW